MLPQNSNPRRSVFEVNPLVGKGVVNALASIAISVSVEGVIVILADNKVGESVSSAPDDGIVRLGLSVGPDVPPELHTGGEGARVPGALPGSDIAIGAGVVGDMRAAAVIGAVENDRVYVIAVEQVNALDALDYLATLIHNGPTINLSAVDDRSRTRSSSRRSNISSLDRAGNGSSECTRKKRGKSEESGGLHFGRG
jgi:hypothetical protein